MTFTVTMKTPDAVENMLDEFDETYPLDDENAIDERRRTARNVLEKWFSYGEYLSVEIDLVSQTATVLPRRNWGEAP